MTYSIVARDPATGHLGVAVQSRYFSTGSVVTWAEAGVGAVATQSFARIDYGPEALALMREGQDPMSALGVLVAADEGRAVRQVACVDSGGRVAAHTGERCIGDAGHIIGDGYSVQANMMANGRVWPAMRDAYEGASGDIADRMLAALDAAQAAGGDVRGQQSAALLVVGGTRSDKPWQGREIELRVEDHPRPLDELARLLRMHRAYALSDEGEAAILRGDIDGARSAFERSLALAPEDEQLQFFAGLAMLRGGLEDEGMRLIGAAFATAPGFADLAPRLARLGMVEPDMLARIEALRP